MTVRDKNIDENLLVKYLLGETTENEFSDVNHWLSVSEENQKQLDDLEVVWLESGKLNTKLVVVDKTLAWDKLSGMIEDHELVIEKRKIAFIRKKALKFTGSIAAAILVIFGLFQILSNNYSNIELQANNVNVINSILPDGSEISLNSNAKLTYPKNFKSKVRKVKLEGEAFFKITPNTEKPFIIDAGAGFIRVVGTEFNVNAPDKNTVEVTVNEGIVELYKIDPVEMDTAKLLLTAGKKGIINQLFSNPTLVSSGKPDELFWKDNTLIFDGTRLDEVVGILEKNFGEQISLQNTSLYNCQLTTTFQNSSLDEIIEVIAFTFNLQFSKQGSTYILQGESCESN